MVIKSVAYSLKFANTNKKNLLDKIYEDYKIELEYLISQITSKQIPFNKFPTSIQTKTINHSGWKQVVYKNAFEIVTSALTWQKKVCWKRYKYLYKKNLEKGRQLPRFSEMNIDFMKRVKPEIKKVTINLDNRMFDIRESSGEFVKFIRIYSPYWQETKKRSIKVNLPIKEHKHSLKFVDWDLKKNVQLSGNTLRLMFERQDVEPQKIEKYLGIDIGYKKLIASSDEKLYGQDLFEIYNKLSNKKRGSKKYKRLITTKKNRINQIVNQFIEDNDFDQLIVEDLKNVKKNSKSFKSFNNKVQYWSYRQVLTKLDQDSKLKGFLVKKIDPAFTSQTCSNCGEVDKDNRQGEVYQCKSCGMTLDADINASKVILLRGIIDPLPQRP